MSRTYKKNDKRSTSKWSKAKNEKPWQYRSTGRGKKLKKAFNKAKRRNGKLEILGAKTKSLSTKASDVNYRGT